MQHLPMCQFEEAKKEVTTLLRLFCLRELAVLLRKNAAAPARAETSIHAQGIVPGGLYPLFIFLQRDEHYESLCSRLLTTLVRVSNEGDHISGTTAICFEGWSRSILMRARDCRKHCDGQQYKPRGFSKGLPLRPPGTLLQISSDSF